MEIRELAHEDWPASLLEIPHVPKRLWVRGTLPPEGTKRLAVVGSRAMSRYGKEACEELIHGLAGYPISIISGLAIGVDACAHEAALTAGLHTLAVPGSGLDDTVLYPRTNHGLAKAILESGGGMLSEYPPEEISRPYYFPERNRLMVGLADAVLVIEAGEKSGTLITARLAGEYNRDLLCIPHRIGDAHGVGANLFIRLGAGLVSEPAHILEALRITPREETVRGTTPQNLTETEQTIWNALTEPKTRDEILRAAGGGAGEILTALVSLEIAGHIKEAYGAWHRL